MHKKARKLIRTYFQMYRLWKTLGSKNRYCSPSLYASINLIECDIGRSTRILCLLPKFSRLCTLRHKHKSPSTARISPRTIDGKNTKNFKSLIEIRIIFQIKAVLSPESQMLSHPAQNPTDRTCDNKQAD